MDNTYVGKKLGLIMFPFLHKVSFRFVRSFVFLVRRNFGFLYAKLFQDWAVKYDTSDSPIPPRLDVNAPDLYIPLMAFVTYILMSGFVLGTQKR